MIKPKKKEPAPTSPYVIEVSITAGYKLSHNYQSKEFSARTTVSVENQTKKAWRIALKQAHSQLKKQLPHDLEFLQKVGGKLK